MKLLPLRQIGLQLIFLTFAFQAIAQAPFSVKQPAAPPFQVMENVQIHCLYLVETATGQKSSCYKPLGEELRIVYDHKIVAPFVDQHDQQLQRLETLIVKRIAFAMDLAERMGDQIMAVPFFAEVNWKESSLGLNGTIQIQGVMVLDLPKDDDGFSAKVKSYSDSGQTAWHRLWESVARRYYFRAWNIFSGKPLDAATTTFLMKFINPGMVAAAKSDAMSRQAFAQQAAALGLIDLDRAQQLLRLK